MIFDALVLGHLRRNGWRVAATIATIAVAVAIALALDVANASIAASLSTATESVVDDADLALVATNERTGFDEAVLATLSESADISDARPATIDTLELGSASLRVRGVDTFAPLPHGVEPRSLLPGPFVRIDPVPDARGATSEHGIFISRAIANRLHVRVGATIAGNVRGRHVWLVVVGLLRDVGANVDTSDAFVDLATSQADFGRLHRLDRIDLVARPGRRDALERALRARAFAGTTLVSVRAHDRDVAAFVRGFATDLAFVAWLTLGAGGVAVGNALSIGVVRRTSDIGTLRMLGATRGRIFATFVAEGALFGAIGSALGLGIGMLLASTFVPHLLVRVDGVSFDLVTVLRAFGIGTAMSIVAAIVPARYAASIVPATAMLARGSATRKRDVTRGSIFLRLASLALATVVPHGVYGALAWTIAIGLLLSVACDAIANLPHRFAWTLPTGLAFAARNFGSAPLRTLAAAATLAIALATATAVATFAESFATSIGTWATRAFPGDFALDVTERSRVLAAVRTLPDVARAMPTATTIAIVATPQADRSRLRRALERVAGRANVVSTRDLRGALVRRLEVARIGADALVALICAIALATVVSTQFALVLERRQEIGTLRIIGARTRTIYETVVFEAALLGIVGAASGIALGIALASELLAVQDARAFAWDVQTHVPFSTILAIGLACVVVASLAATLPARAAVRARVANAQYVA